MSDRFAPLQGLAADAGQVSGFSPDMAPVTQRPTVQPEGADLQAF